jgi:hypothetical protein
MHASLLDEPGGDLVSGGHRLQKVFKRWGGDNEPPRESAKEFAGHG